MTSGTEVNHTDLLGEAPDGQKGEQEDTSEGEVACGAAYPDDLSIKTASEESGKCSPEETPASKPLRGY